MHQLMNLFHVQRNVKITMTGAYKALVHLYLVTEEIHSYEDSHFPNNRQLYG